MEYGSLLFFMFIKTFVLKQLEIIIVGSVPNCCSGKIIVGVGEPGFP